MSEPKRGFVPRVFRDAGSNPAPYILFIPHDYTEERRWPAILFLHGAGETGSDGARQVEVGIGPAVAKRESPFPFFVLFPQSQRGTWQARTPDAARALAILDSVQSEFAIDPDRVHLTGISMGGYGAWSLAAAEPDRWASLVPVCGGGDPRTAARIAPIRCWAFHGDADEVIPVSRSREMIQALRDAGASPRYTEFPGVGHNSWDAAYATPDLYDWLASNRRVQAPQP